MQKRRKNGWMVKRKREERTGKRGEEERWRDGPKKKHNERVHLFPLRLGFSDLIVQESSIVTTAVLLMAKCTVFSIQGRLLLAC